MAGLDFDTSVLDETEEALGELRARLTDFGNAAQRLDAGQQSMAAAVRQLADLANAQETAGAALTRAAQAMTAAAPDQMAEQLNKAIALLGMIHADQAQARLLVQDSAQSMRDQTKAIGDSVAEGNNRLRLQMTNEYGAICDQIEQRLTRLEQTLKKSESQQAELRQKLDQTLQCLVDQSAQTRRDLDDARDNLRRHVSDELRAVQSSSRLWMMAAVALSGLTAGMLAMLLIR